MLRLFVTDRLEAGLDIQATAGQAHYLGTVMRRGAGEAVALFNGRDGEWRARLTAIRRERASFLVETALRTQAPEPDLWLVFCPLKRDATDLVVQKATELGVSALLPVLSARTNSARINPDRLAAIAIEAAEQSERLTVPDIRAPVKLHDLLAAWPADRPLAAAIERDGSQNPPRDAGALLVGPEGGFTAEERDSMARCRFLSSISLGPRILRAETAAIAGLALLQAAGWSTN